MPFVSAVPVMQTLRPPRRPLPFLNQGDRLALISYALSSNMVQQLARGPGIDTGCRFARCEPRGS